MIFVILHKNDHDIYFLIFKLLCQEDQILLYADARISLQARVGRPGTTSEYSRTSHTLGWFSFNTPMTCMISGGGKEKKVCGLSPLWSISIIPTTCSF